MEPGPTIGVRRSNCAVCYAKHPREDLIHYEGSLLCSPCQRRLIHDRAKQTREETHRIKIESRALKLDDVSSKSGALTPPSEQEKLRDRLLQLEYEKRRRPHDLELLKEIVGIYDKLGDFEEASKVRVEIQKVDPRDPSIQGQPVGKQGIPVYREAPPTPFWEDIPGIFTYPLRGKGLSLIIVGGIVFGFALWLAQYSLFGWVLSFLIHGYLWAFWFRVMNYGAQGNKEAPDWPEFADPWQSICRPTVAAFICHMIPFGPAVFFGGLILMGPLPFNAITILLGAVLLLAGFFAYPMTLLVYGLFNSLPAAANYKFVHDSISKILPDYILALTALSILGAMNMVAIVALSAAISFFVPIPILGGILLHVLVWVSEIYFGLAMFRLLGHLYHQSVGRLGWFGEITEPEKTLNLGVVFAGVGGVSLVALVGLGAVLILPGLIVNATGVTDLPFEDGSYLSYEVMDSDWGTSRMRYDVAAVPGGFRITGTQERGRDWPWVTEFTVNSRGEVIGGRDMLAGPLPLFTWGDVAREQTIFCGPTRAWVAGEYINGYTVEGKDSWKGFDVWKVGDDVTTANFYYDRNTGYLVGMECTQIGRHLWCILRDTNVSILRIP